MNLYEQFEEDMAVQAAKNRAAVAPQPQSVYDAPRSDIDSWESPANVQQGISTVNAQPFVNPVGAAPAPPVQAAPAFVGDAQVVSPAYQHLTRTTPEYTQSIVPPDTRTNIEKALAMLGDTPLPGLSGGMYGGRGKTSDLGTAYNTEIPYYTDFARGTIQPALGQLGELAGAGVDMQSGGLSQLLNRQLGTPTTAQAGRFAGEAFAPVTLGDVALGAATGNVTGFDDLIKSGVMSATKSYADNALRAGLGAVPEGAVARTVAPAAPLKSVPEARAVSLRETGATPWSGPNDKGAAWLSSDGEVFRLGQGQYHAQITDIPKAKAEGWARVGSTANGVIYVEADVSPRNADVIRTYIAKEAGRDPTKTVVIENTANGTTWRGNAIEWRQQGMPPNMPANPPNIPRGISPTEGTGIMRTGGAADDIESWEYSLKRLQQAKEQGPEAFAAEKARQAQVASGKVAETQATNAANARTRFSNTSKAQLEDTRAAMEAAQARLKPGSAISAADDATTSGVSAGRSVGSPPSPSTGTAALKGLIQGEEGALRLPAMEPPRLGPGSSLPPTPEDIGAIGNFFETRREILDNLSQDAGKLRKVSAAVSGDIESPWLAEMVASETELKQLASQVIKGASPVEHEVLTDHIVKSFRDQMVKALPQEQQADVLKALRAADVERSAHGVASDAYDFVNDTMRSMVLGGDVMGVAGQQGLRAMRGSPAIASGLIQRGLQAFGLDTGIYKPGLDRVAQAIADGLQMGKGGSTADIAKGGGLLSKVGLDQIPVVKNIPGAKLANVGKLSDAVADLQFGKGLGAVRLRAYEGLLLQNKALHSLTRGLIGGDVSDPIVRRHIAEFANVLGSSGRPATQAKRAALERRALLSPRMTRAQINEVLTPLKTFRSSEDALNTINLTLGTALVFAAANEVNKEIGVTDLVTTPGDFGWGSITTKFKDSAGNNRSVDFLPQASFVKAIISSVDALKEQDVARMGQAWERYAFGRSGLVPAAAARLTAGLGWGDDGKFYGLTNGKRMPLDEAASASLPVPLPYKGLVEGDSDLGGLAASQAGLNARPESVYSAEDRYAQERYGEGYMDLDLPDRAAVHAQMAAEGKPIDPWRRAGPYFDADDMAFKEIQATIPQLGQYRDYRDFKASLTMEIMDSGASRKKAEQTVEKIEKAMGLDAIAKAMKKGVLAADPDIAQVLVQGHNDGTFDYGVADWVVEFAAKVKEKANASP